MNCKDCIYFKRCVVLGVELDMNHDKEADKNCRYFKNKSNVVEVVRCKDCIYFQDRYVELPDGSKRPYKKGESSVPLSVGINVGSYCTRIDYAIVHGYRHGEPSVDETRL